MNEKQNCAAVIVFISCLKGVRWCLERWIDYCARGRHCFVLVSISGIVICLPQQQLSENQSVSRVSTKGGKVNLIAIEICPKAPTPHPNHCALRMMIICNLPQARQASQTKSISIHQTQWTTTTTTIQIIIKSAYLDGFHLWLMNV